MWISLSLVSVWVLAVYLSRKRYGDVFTPVCVYTSVWCICLLLFHLRLIDYHELNRRTVLLISGSMLGFGSGCFLAGKVNQRRKRPFPKAFRLEKFEAGLKVLAVVHVVGLVWFAVRMLSSYGIETYLRDSLSIRVDHDNWPNFSPLGPFMLAFYPVFACSFVHWLMTRRIRWFSAVGLIGPIIHCFLLTDRGTLVYLVLTCLFIWIYIRRRDRITVRLASAGLAVVFVAILYFVGLGVLEGRVVSPESGDEYSGNMNVTSEVMVTLAYPYIYATGSFPAFQEGMSDVRSFSLGTRTFYPALIVLKKFWILSEVQGWAIYDYYYVPIPMNTYTWLFTFYQDFGIAGVLVLPFVFGYLETRLYLRMKMAPTFLLILGTSALMVVNIFSVFIPLSSLPEFWFYFLAVGALSRYCWGPMNETASRPGALLMRGGLSSSELA